MVAGKVERLAQRTVDDEREERGQGRCLMWKPSLCQRTRRKDYRSKRQLVVVVLKEVGNRGELERPTPDNRDDGTGSPQLQPEASESTPPSRPVEPCSGALFPSWDPVE